MSEETLISEVCPYCEKKVSVKYIKQPVKIHVRDEVITVDDEFIRCLTCNGEFLTSEILDDESKDPLRAAYKIYNERHPDDKIMFERKQR